MKKLLTLAVLAFMLMGSTPQDTYVYICKGPESKKYHLRQNCQGLGSCSTDIYKVTLAEAKKMGRGLCGWED